MNRCALVTGAAGGLAAGIAPALARDGFSRVAITYRTTPPDATIEAIVAAGAAATAVRVDFLEDAELVEAALGDAVARFGPFDTLVHAVGPLVVKRFERTTLEEYREAFDGNVRSAVLAARAVLPSMRAAGFGRHRVLRHARFERNAAVSRLYVSIRRRRALWSRSRAALPSKKPGTGSPSTSSPPATFARRRWIARGASQRPAGNPRGRAGSYEDVADAVRFLVARERDFVTGAVIEVTGGLQTAADS